MKRMRGYQLGSRAFRKYFFSYCLLLGVILNLMILVIIWQTAENMEAEEIRVTENKLYTIAEDMEIQIEALKMAALETASKTNFRLDYFQVNEYREIELLTLLADYKKSNDICGAYFLYYTEHDVIFASSKTTMPLSVYWHNEFAGEGYSDFARLLDEVSTEAADWVVFHRQGNETLLLCPMKKYAASSIGREGVLCFRISEEKLLERVEKLVGILRGRLSIYYNDICILEGTGEDPGNIYELQSQAGNFKICFYPETDNYFSWSNVFSLERVLFFAGILILLAVIGYFMAYWSFNPLRKLAEKYKLRTNDKLAAEWESLDLLIDTLLNGNERNNKMLQEQYQMFREQTIRLIASGGYSERVQEYMTLLNIQLETSVYGIIKCCFLNKDESEKNWKGLHREVEDLSGDGTHLYPYWDSSDSLHVLAAVDEEYQLEEIMERLEALFAVKNRSARLELAGFFREPGQICQNPPMGAAEELSGRLKSEAAGDSSGRLEPEAARDSYGKLFSEMEAEEEQSDCLNCCAETKEIGKRRDNTANKAMEYIRLNCIDNNLSLDLVAQKLQVTPNYLSRIIKQKTGMSYKEYLTGLRIAEAKKMLLDQNMSVMDVCLGVGYVNASHFIKIFQEYTGMTPARFRDERAAD